MTVFIYVFITYLIFYCVFVDLISGATYTVYVSSSNDITDQVPDDQFGTIAASVQGTTLGRL